MFWTVFSYELRRHLRSISFYVFTALLALIVFLFAQNTDPNTSILFPIGREWHNAPLVVARIFVNLSMLSLLFTLVLAARSVIKDFDANIHEFFFTTPVTKFAYLGGRLTGGLAANLLNYVGVIVGMVLGCLIIDGSYSGPFRLDQWLVNIGIILIPNLVFIGCLFFCLATLTRKMTMTYVAGIALITVYLAVTYGTSTPEFETLRALADPVAGATLTYVTKYWTVADINTRAVPLEPLLIINRLIWLGVAAVAFGVTYWRFSFTARERKSRNRQAETDRIAQPEPTLEPYRGIPLESTLWGDVRKALSWMFRDARQILLHPAFIILTFLAVQTAFLNFYMNVFAGGQNVYPLTSWFLDRLDSILVITIPIMIFFGGMLVWKERDDQSHHFYDTLPVPSWVIFASKLGTLAVILAVYLLVNMLTGIATQVLACISHEPSREGEKARILGGEIELWWCLKGMGSRSWY